LATELFLDGSVQGLAQQIVFGLATGGLYASLALALVLIYQAMETLNFAQGEMATFMTFVAWSLLTYWNLPFWLVFPATVALAFLGGVLVERVIIRPVERRPVITLVLVTLGLFAIFNGLSGAIWGFVVRPFPSPFPVTPVFIGGVGISYQDLGLIGVSAVVLVLIYIFFSRTRLGLMMRSSALYPEASRLLGVRVGWMLALGWGLASAVGAVSGMMVAPITVLDPAMMQSVLLYAFTAAVLGGIDSPIGAVAGGLTVGVLLALVGTYIPHADDLRLAFGFVVIIVVLVVKPGGMFGRPHVERV
jgi:branched-chain amino acid transport system permease protein